MATLIYLGILLGFIQKVRHIAKQHFLTPVCLCNFLQNDKLWHDTEKCFFIYISAGNFQSIKNRVELNSLLSKLFCYITSLVISPDQTRLWTTFKRGLYVKYYCFVETIVQRFKNYRLIWLFKHTAYQRMQKSHYIKGCRKVKKLPL